MPPAQLGTRAGYRHGFAVIIALDPLATDFLEEGQLLSGLHALGKDMHAHAFCHQHDAGDDVAALRVEVLEETHVQLDEVETIGMEDVQRGILRAEIVEPDLVSGIVDRLDGAGHLAAVLRKPALRDLDMDVFPGNLVFRHGFLKAPQRVSQVEIQLGEIEGNGNQVQAAFQPLMEGLHDMVDHVGVQTADTSGVLQDRDEDTGHDHAALGILPPRQRLERTHFARKSPHDGLVVQLDVSFLQGKVEVLEDILPFLQTILHLFGENHIGVLPVVLGSVAGDLRHIERMPDHLLRYVRVEHDHAGLQCGALGPDIAVHQSAGLLDLFPQPVAGQNGKESIRIGVAEQPFRECLPQCLSDVGEEPVACIYAVFPVEATEIGDVEADRAVVREIAVVPGSLGHVYGRSEEIFPAEKSGELVRDAVRQFHLLADQVQEKDLPPINLVQSDDTVGIVQMAGGGQVLEMERKLVSPAPNHVG